MGSIFELTIVRRYSFRGVSSYERMIFLDVESAEKQIAVLAEDKGNADVFCYILRELPFGRHYMEEECLTECVYLNSGKKMNERLFSSIRCEGEFHGREPGEVLFKEDDIVEILNLTSNKVSWGIISASPRSVEWVEKNYPLGESQFHLDASDDSYIVLEGVRNLKGISKERYMRSHIHVSTLRAFPKTQKEKVR